MRINGLTQSPSLDHRNRTELPTQRKPVGSSRVRRRKRPTKKFAAEMLGGHFPPPSDAHAARVMLFRHLRQRDKMVIRCCRWYVVIRSRIDRVKNETQRAINEQCLTFPRRS